MTKFCDQYSLCVLKWEISRHKNIERMVFYIEVGERGLVRRDFIRASSKHKEARQKLDYWEMEVSCRVTVAVCREGGGLGWRWERDSEMIPSKSSFILLDEEEMPHPQSRRRAC